MIDDCLVYLDHFDAVSLSIPLVDTVSICKKNEIKKMLNRDELRALQTPQGFNFNKIKLAHEKYHEDATDDIRLMFEDGLKNVKLLMDMKITLKLLRKMILKMH